MRVPLFGKRLWLILGFLILILINSCQVPTPTIEPFTSPDLPLDHNRIELTYPTPTHFASSPTPCQVSDNQPTPVLEVPLIVFKQEGRNFYFDSVGGNDGNSGVDPQQPWQSLKLLNSYNFEPGDTIHLKRGSTWNGTLFIWGSGQQDQPIIYTSYGEEGAAPMFRNPENGNELTTAIRITADWVVVQQLQIQDAKLAGVFIAVDADHNLIQGNEISAVGEGVAVHGQYSRIIGNYIHDLKMVHNTQGGDDDYGAIGVWLFNSDNEVAFNRLVRLKAASYDYGSDGGAIEFYKQVDRSLIHHNYVADSEGFLEIGGAKARDNRIYYNLIVNSGRVLGVHLGGKFGSAVRGLRIENNTVIDNQSKPEGASFQFWWGDPEADTLNVQNNIFYLPNYQRLVSNGEIGFNHNLIYMPAGTDT